MEPREVNCSPLWAVHLPGFERILSQAGQGQVQAGPVSKAAKAGVKVAQAGPVAVVGIKGVLEKRRSWFLDMFGGTSYLDIKAAVNAAVADRGIEEILLLVDSPGGSVDGIVETAELIREARAQKRVTAFIDGYGASAAYWLAAQATEVVAGRTALVGSIGVIHHMYDMSKMYEKAGVKPVVFATGELKGTGVPGTEITAEQKKMYQGIVDSFGEEFRAAVVKGRNLDPKAVAKVATGAIWLGREAVEQGLVDRTGTFEETFASLGAGAARKASSRGRARAAVAQARARGLL